MQRKFECLECHHRFEADDRGEVKCPRCQSDNVEIIHFRIPRGMWKYAAAFVLFLLMILCVFRMCKHGGGEKIEPTVDSLETIDTTDAVNMFIDPDVKIVEPPKIANSSDPIYTNEGYSFTVKIQNAPSTPYYVALLEHRGKTIISKSEDGVNFTKVPPSKNEEGLYDLAIFDEKSDSLLGEKTPKPGFIDQSKLSSKMTVQQLQSLIDNDDMSLYGVNDYIDPNCELHFTGLSAETKNIPTSLGEMMEKVGKMWSTVKVTKLEYNDKNRITSITFAVQEN